MSRKNFKGQFYIKIIEMNFCILKTRLKSKNSFSKLRIDMIYRKYKNQKPDSGQSEILMDGLVSHSELPYIGIF